MPKPTSLDAYYGPSTWFLCRRKKKKNSPRFDKNVLFLMLVVHFVKFNFGYGREPEKELYGMSDLNRAQERGKCL